VILSRRNFQKFIFLTSRQLLFAVQRMDFGFAVFVWPMILLFFQQECSNHLEDKIEFRPPHSTTSADALDSNQLALADLHCQRSLPQADRPGSNELQVIFECSRGRQGGSKKGRLRGRVPHSWIGSRSICVIFCASGARGDLCAVRSWVF
jgi:hypothetical protein